MVQRVASNAHVLMNSSKQEDSSTVLDCPESLEGEKRRVLLVDDHPITRQGLAALINQAPDLTVCGEADSMPRALELLSRVKPMLVIADISLKTSNGLELVKTIDSYREHLKLKLLASSGSDLVQRAIQWVKSENMV